MCYEGYVNEHMGLLGLPSGNEFWVLMDTERQWRSGT